MVIALAGRRIDSIDATKPAFPLGNVAHVRSELRQLFEDLQPIALVCSAACGADLIALDEARQLGIRSRVVLPSSREHFRSTSVVDRPGDWGPLYDEILTSAEARGDVIELSITPDSEEAFAVANNKILEEAAVLSQYSKTPVMAVLLWEGSAHEGSDLTSTFAEAARQRNIPARQIHTL